MKFIILAVLGLVNQVSSLTQRVQDHEYLPKGYQKWTDEQWNQWIAEQEAILEQQRQEEQELGSGKKKMLKKVIKQKPQQIHDKNIKILTVNNIESSSFMSFEVLQGFLRQRYFLALGTG